MTSARSVVCLWLAVIPTTALAQPKPAAPTPTVTASAGPPAREAVEATLNASNRPVGARELAELGPRVDETLVDIASDDKAATALRARAISAMAYARSPRALAYLRKTVDGAFNAKTADDRLLVRKAALSYGWQGIPGSPGDLAPLLGHPDADVRVDAGVALALTRLKEAVPPLERHVETEKDAWVRRQLTRQLEQLKKNAGEPPKRRPPGYRPAIPPATHDDPTAPRIGERP